MKDFFTIKKDTESSIEEKKSVFIAAVSHVTNEEEAISFLNSVRAKHPTAKHNVYAYILNENSIMRYSDDKEPQGTAGLPVLDVLRKNELSDVCIVVTRYFGGILLGTGGLVRAYTSAAAEAVSDAGIVKNAIFSQYIIEASYSDYGKITSELNSDGVFVTDTVFEDLVKVHCDILFDTADEKTNRITDITNGKAVIKKTGEKRDFVDI